jgi:hypothetical protein
MQTSQRAWKPCSLYLFQTSLIFVLLKIRHDEINLKHALKNPDGYISQFQLLDR